MTYGSLLIGCIGCFGCTITIAWDNQGSHSGRLHAKLRSASFQICSTFAISNQQSAQRSHKDLLRFAPETTRGSISSHANKTLSTLAPTPIRASILPDLLSAFKVNQIKNLVAYISNQGLAWDNWGFHLWSGKQAIIISNKVQICTSIANATYSPRIQSKHLKWRLSV